MSNLLILLLCVFLLSGCGGHSNRNSNYTQAEIDLLHLDETKFMPVEVSSVESVDLNPFLGRRFFDFESLVSDIRFIPLETNDSSLLDNIYKIILSDDYIYVFDDFKGGGIVIFTKSGKFVRRISHGGGPGELYGLTDIAYDSKRKLLLAYQHPFLLLYTADGAYIRQKKLPFGFYNFAPTSNGFVFKTLDGLGNEHLGSLQNCTFLVTDSNFVMKYASLPAEYLKANYGGYAYLHGDAGNVQITANNNDTVFHYIPSKSRLEAAYVMDYSDKKLPLSYWNLSGREFSELLSKKNYYYFIGEYLETNAHQVFFLRNDYLKTRTVVYRDKYTGKMSGGSEARFNIHRMPAIAFPKSVYKDYFVSLHYPSPMDSCWINSPLVSSADKQVMAGLVEDDNPVLVLYHIKISNEHE